MAYNNNKSNYKSTRGYKPKYKFSTKKYVKQYKPEDNDALKQATVYRYPFSTATTIPKIPDGTGTTSIGITYTAVTTIQNFVNQKNNFILYPGMNTWGCESADGGVDHISTTSHANYTVIKQLDEDVGTTTVESYHLRPGTGKGTSKNLENYWAKWRVVSCGMRMKCINNDQENDGYWEAVRINMDEDEHHIIDVTNTTDANVAATNVGKVYPSDQLRSDVKDAKHWQTNPTYQTGKIKDLWKFEGRLKPRNLRHPWIDCPAVIKYRMGDYNTFNNGTATTPVNINYIPTFHSEAFSGLQMSDVQNFMDKSWDSIAIKFHGINNTKILLTTKINYELIPMSNMLISQYASECSYAPKLVESKYNNYRMKDQKPLSYVFTK